MKKLSLCIAVLAMLAGCGKSAPPVAKPSPSAPVYGPVATNPSPNNIVGNLAGDMPDEKERMAVMTMWQASAEEVAAKSGDKTAQDLTQFLKQNGRLVAPLENGKYVVLSEIPQGATAPFYIMPLLRADASKGSRYADFLKGALGGSFDKNQRVMLLLDGRDFTSSWRGILYLHELGHAAYDEPGHEGDDQWYGHQEKEAYTFEGGIIAKLGGEPYTKFFRSEVDKIKPGLTQKKGVHTPDTKLYATGLDPIFGKSKSQNEQNIRTAAVWIAAVMTAMDELYSAEEADQRKIDFMVTFYRQQGHLPSAPANG